MIPDPKVGMAGKSISQGMNIDDTYPIKEVFSDLVEHIERDLKIPTGFFESLLQENDWSFVIKTHAVIEAAVSQALASVLNENLLPVFQKLELSDMETGKIVFAKYLSILDSNQYRFVRKLSELRNKVVHNISEIDFDLVAHIGSLDKNQRRSVLKILTLDETKEAGEWMIKMAQEHPKLAIWYSMVTILLRITVTSVSSRLERKVKESSYKVMMKMAEGDQRIQVSGEPPIAKDQDSSDPSSYGDV